MTWLKAVTVFGSVVGGVLLSIPAALGFIGFTSAGIASGSIAASIMSSAAIANGGGVAAGSLVAICQSVGATGLAMSTKGIVVAAGASLGVLAK